MTNDFWLQRWKNQQIGWHKNDFHPKLVALGETIFKQGSSVFVPLCGKSKDMLWFANQGYQVIGCELSKIAVDTFFSELNLPAVISKKGQFNCYQSGPYTIYQGDFFALPPEYLSRCNGWYDRASLIALPQSMRQNYALKLLELFKPGSKALVVSLSYQSESKKGPPYSVTPSEVKSLWPNVKQLTHLATTPTTLSGSKSSSEQPSNALENDISHVEEHVFELTI